MQLSHHYNVILEEHRSRIFRASGINARLDAAALRTWLGLDVGLDGPCTFATNQAPKPAVRSIRARGYMDHSGPPRTLSTPHCLILYQAVGVPVAVDVELWRWWPALPLKLRRHAHVAHTVED